MTSQNGSRALSSALISKRWHVVISCAIATDEGSHDEPSPLKTPTVIAPSSTLQLRSNSQVPSLGVRIGPYLTQYDHFRGSLTTASPSDVSATCTSENS